MTAGSLPAAPGPDPVPSATPRVSILTATYNRSNVLRLVIETVRRQTVTDWEWIIVGDACTDDTAAVVASFHDPRIRFINLERGYGEQSGPNNEAFRLSRAPALAYLAHDDLWLPDHLEGDPGGAARHRSRFRLPSRRDDSARRACSPSRGELLRTLHPARLRSAVGVGAAA